LFTIISNTRSRDFKLTNIFLGHSLLSLSLSLSPSDLQSPLFHSKKSEKERSCVGVGGYSLIQRTEVCLGPQAKMGRGVIADKWSMRILWGCAFGSAIGLWMVGVDRQKENREKVMAESLRAMDADGQLRGKDV
ncbi:hypothetical protein GIB67_008816, partial [Kingdonia uniflora]